MLCFVSDCCQNQGRPVVYQFRCIRTYKKRIQTVKLHLPFTIYYQCFFHSVRRNPSLNCLHRRRSLAILGHAGPRWRIRLSLHLVLGLPCRLVHSRGVHSVTLFVFVSYNVSRPSMYSRRDNVYDIIYTCLMSYLGITFVVA